MKIFVGGSKTLNRLPQNAQKIICSIIRHKHEILVGDCYGIDLAVQHFLNENNYKKVTIYSACKKARQNVGDWHENIIRTDKTGYLAHREKDEALINACDIGIMIWDGKSKGTLYNIERLKTLNKKSVVIHGLK